MGPVLLCAAILTPLGAPARANATGLPRATPEQAGFSSAGLAKVDALIQDSVDKGFPGAVLAIVRDGKLVKLSAYGYAKRNDEKGALADPAPMRTDTLFDLASNTKIYATTYALQRLVYQGKVDLDSPVKRYLPEFADAPGDPIKGKATVTVAQLLRHTSGALANPLYYDRKAMGALYSQDRQTTYTQLARTPLAFPPDTRNVYSDLGFMLLGRIVERVSGMPLEDYVEQFFYAPLGVRTLYAPLRGNARLHGFTPADCAATELHGNTRDGTISFDNVRTRTIQGEVQDEKAFYSLDQVAGHAGLFSDAESLALLEQLMLDGGSHDGHSFFDQETIDVFTAPAARLDPSYALGWRVNASGDLFFGRYASPRAIGHTGWTGTATLIDPQYRLGIVLLTNKKNTPVANRGKDGNRFLGDLYPISLYRSVMEQIYLAMRTSPPR